MGSCHPSCSRGGRVEFEWKEICFDELCRLGMAASGRVYVYAIEYLDELRYLVVD
jgi:hypothetical protein